MSRFATPRRIVLAATLGLGIVAQAAQIERAQDLDHFYFGQSGLGVHVGASVDTAFGTLAPVFDDGASMRWDGHWTASASDSGTTATVASYHSLSLMASQNGAGETDGFLIDVFATLDFSGESSVPGSTVSVASDSLAAPAYADVWLQQSFRILPSAGESVGDAVRITVGADFFPSLHGSDPRSTSEVLLDGLPGEPFSILLNGTPLYTAGAPVTDAGSLYFSTFTGQVGDVLTFQGPTLLSRLTVDGQRYDGESWSTSVGGGFFAGISVAAVPETGTWSMMTLGLALLGVAGRRRQGKR